MTHENDKDSNVPDWARGDPLMEWYATTIWGNRILEDDRLFEIMSLQIFQAGLNWKMILARMGAFRSAFKDWRIDEVASFGTQEIQRMLNNVSIIRNRKKIEACILNARIIQSIRKEHGSFCHWFYDVLEGDDLENLQIILRRTFKFVGPEIAHMWLRASGRISVKL